MTPRRRIIELRLAMMMLTRLPMGRLPDAAPDLAQARWAFPLTGLPVGFPVWVVLGGAGALNLPPLAGAFAALAAAAALTGGLHHDGFADFADGMGGRDRAHRLEIMRDSRIGSYGVIALLFAVGLSASALSAVPASAWAGILLVAVFSRLSMLVLLDMLPSARDDGLGRMAASDRTGFRPAWLPGIAVAGVLALVLGPPALLVFATISGAALFIAWRANRLLGGQTGDVLGAAQLASETAGWLALAAAL